MRAPWDIRRCTSTDLFGARRIGEAAVDGSDVEFDVSPFDIVTLKLEPVR